MSTNGASATNARERGAWSSAVTATIKAERAARGLTQSDMIERSGLSRSTYIRIDQGERVPDITQLARISHALKMRLSEFIYEAERRMNGQQA